MGIVLCALISFAMTMISSTGSAGAVTFAAIADKARQADPAVARTDPEQLASMIGTPQIIAAVGNDFPLVKRLYGVSLPIIATQPIAGDIEQRGHSVAFSPRTFLKSAVVSVTPDLAVARSAGAGATLFGVGSARLARLPMRQGWDRAAAKASGDLSRLAACGANASRCADRRQQGWAKIVDTARTKQRGEQIAFVNSALNRLLPYRSDRDNWGVEEYWASPGESLARGGADCEDYVILKYWTLRALGFADDDMRVVALKDRYRNFNHAVLIVSFNGSWLVLDSRYARVRFEADLPNYQPIYTFNVSGQWAYLEGHVAPNVPFAFGAMPHFR
ncbi:MAG TPA: transglutaminase-like cysteine peptidase [Candidatus Defluviicoccus seviourii]|nr:transglutaminase-like cysteine peptidase [Candidatus Defluviicoccus seviourii]